MKKILLLAVLLSANSILAQTTKGKILVSGGVGLQFISSNQKTIYDGKTDETAKINSSSISPSFAYFVKDNLAVGLTSQFANTKVEVDGVERQKTGTTIIAPTAIYYFTVDGKIRPLAQIGIGYASFNVKEDKLAKVSYSGLSLNLGGGVCYFIKENISFNFGLSYTKNTMKNADDEKEKLKQSNFATNIGISLFF